MKKYLLLLTIIALFVLSATAQQTTTVTRLTTTTTSLANRVVKDSTGAIIPGSQWQKLMLSGGYQLRSKSIDADTLILVKMTPQEIELRNSFMPPLPPSPAFPIGEKKELFNARDINGQKVDFKILQGKVVVLNFWFIGCAPCQQEIPELNQLVADNPDVVFIGFSTDLKYEVKDFLKATPFNYRQIYDAREDCNRYGIASYPTNVVIDKNGITRFSSSGYGPGSITYLKKTIAEAKAQN
ncbi:TlpA family protein disulfide reductase [Mucilaginibacter psychrotolerans]|uniref:TlpA family protein disulfide reductase n=1 Tax=Mucilaginibacter psychrotolerans TaxID=1524096 RepID=A0A4Y8SQ78_9SPHI|nr:TlpA disulfide reductase family protein [Mucilaginibacter psychrotolerans]TFF40952.1 TlpA family protein disulfide reductase [Mucilaginibacter psychrotolerans]